MLTGEFEELTVPSYISLFIESYITNEASINGILISKFIDSSAGLGYVITLV
jgi:hypothetical protein